MTGSDLHRGLGQAEGRLTALERDIREIKASLAEQDRKLDAIEKLLSEVRGGWKVLAAAGAVGAALMAFLIKVVPHIPIGR